MNSRIKFGRGNVMQNEIKAPPDWGEDKLSKYIKEAWHNTYATFANLRPQYNHIKEIHLNYQKIIDNLINTPDWFASFFLMRSHASYLGAVQLSLSGQIPETYMVLRGCLENSLYGLYVTKNPDTQEIWLKRDENDESKKKCRNEFSASNLFKCLETEDRKINNIAKNLYEMTIDYGAHPNERAFMSLMSQSKDEQKVDFKMYYLIGDSSPFRLCLKNSARIGVCSLYIFKLIYRHRFDILRISDKLEKLKRGL